MVLRYRTWILTLGLSVAAVSTVLAQPVIPPPVPAHSEPARLDPQTRQDANHVPLNNQKAAEAIAARLRQAEWLRGYRIDITYQWGIVELTGQVADQRQRQEVERLLRSIVGVEKVINRLEINQPTAVVQTQILQPPPVQGSGTPPPPAPGANLPPTSPPPQEPTPIHRAPPPGAPNGYQAPRMPPYAWPTYAPYNNYSRVAYPTTYPHNAWPFIGPMYPFPKVPPGWRSVNLTWQDGFWWYGRNATGYNWWQLRFW